MKNLFGFGALAAVAILVTACSKTPQAGDAIPEVAFEEAAPDYRIANSFNNVRAFQLELNDSCAIDEIRRIIEAGDNGLLVLTKNELFAFDKNTGRFMQRIGNTGEGPNEYLNITDFYYDNKDETINIIDTYSGKLVRYGIRGNFVSKEKIPFTSSWFNSVARSDNGYMMVSNLMTGGMLTPPSEYAYTVVEPNGEFYSLDPFAPVTIDQSFATEFAKRPAVATGERLTFFKFLNDTIFTVENGEISPKYKLSLKKPIPRKDVVAQAGNFPSCLFSMARGGDYCSVFNEIYETEKYIVLVPQFSFISGYFWIDKASGTGIHFLSSGNWGLALELMLKGESIFNIKGSKENSLATSFEAQEITSAKKCLSENPDLACFNEDVKAVFENADPEGNPVVIIYSH